MNPGSPPPPPFDQILVETPNGCFVNKARSAPAAAFPLRAAADPSPQPPSSTPAEVFEGGSSSALPARRRRTQVEPAEQPSPADTDMIGRFQTIINIVESTGASARPRPEVGELLKAVQRLKLATGEPPHRRQKRQRRPTETPAAASASLLQETIAAIEQMRLSEPMESSREYAEVLDKLRELLRGEEVDDG